MTNEEKTSLKAACLQAATTLIAARDSMKGAVDLDECVRLATELYCRVTTTNWQDSTSYEAFRADNLAERGCALANAAVELPDKDHPARRAALASSGHGWASPFQTSL